MSDSLNIFSFYKTLLKYDGIDSYKIKTISKVVDDLKTYNRKILDINNEKGVITIEEYSFEDIKMTTSTFSFYDDLEKELNKEVQNCISNIDASIVEITKIGNSSEAFLKNIKNEIRFIKAKVDDLFSSYPKIKDSILKIEEHLLHRYNIKSSSPIIDTSTSFFNIKSDIKINTLINLYELAEELEIIDSYIVSQESFLEVLSGNTKETDHSIIFNCDNQLAVHFINSIQPLFHNLIPSKIAKSESFFSKRKTLLQQSNIDTAKSQLKKNSSIKVQQISEAITSLLEST